MLVGSGSFLTQQTRQSPHLLRRPFWGTALPALWDPSNTKPASYIIILYDPTSLSLGGLEWALVEFCAEALHSLHVLFKLYKWCYLILVSACQAKLSAHVHALASRLQSSNLWIPNPVVIFDISDTPALCKCLHPNLVLERQKRWRACAL